MLSCLGKSEIAFFFSDFQGNWKLELALMLPTPHNMPVFGPRKLIEKLGSRRQKSSNSEVHNLALDNFTLASFKQQGKLWQNLLHSRGLFFLHYCPVKCQNTHNCYTM